MTRGGGRYPDKRRRKRIRKFPPDIKIGERTRGKEPVVRRKADSREGRR